MKISKPKLPDYEGFYEKVYAEEEGMEEQQLDEMLQ